ncbi:tyrosine-type recombinase/integrase [Acinetobacter sichuanensis]|uniref:Site-specific integrase n=1 Tax=Acinetobacter sichuanensis TaxID=2136183 RepID=A0A371YJY2_9GAMM|nr:tyrosine-type recombinase/integrase [Acinetobacter sichuanensis]RFC81771.1 site-specific integrase [Acinetobacter sichuanensis]
MSAGLEIRGKSMRIWIKTNTAEPIIKETLDWQFTPENQRRAKSLAELIKLEIQLDQFDLAKHFPNSKNLKKNQISYYAQQYLNMTVKEVAPSTYDSYYGHVKNHINPKWGKVAPKDINTNMLKRWIQQLKETLNNKTVREILTRFAQIHALWRDENQQAYNPFQNIVIQQADTPEPDPFNKTEIALLLNTQTDLDIENLLPCLFWTGLSMSEQIPIAWEDIDLEKGTIWVSRSYVRGVYRVTKNRRRKREVKLLQPAVEALKNQYKITGNRHSKIIQILQRDNKSYKQERVRFVWINQEQGDHFEYHELRYRWNKHLKKAKVRHRGINQGRHTFASQLLTSGQVPPEWIADQLGHADTSMIYKHYGKLIAEDLPDYLTKINDYIQQ